MRLEVSAKVIVELISNIDLISSQGEKYG